MGIPLFYAALLFITPGYADGEVVREDYVRVLSIVDLREPNKPNQFYYEVLECVRRNLLATVIVFIYLNKVAQVVVTLTMVVIFGLLLKNIILTCPNGIRGLVECHTLSCSLLCRWLHAES